MLETMTLSLFKISLGKLIFTIDKNINDLPLDDSIRIIWNNGLRIRHDGILTKYILDNNLATQEIIDDIYDNAPKKHNKLRIKKGLKALVPQVPEELPPDENSFNEKEPITDSDVQKLNSKTLKEIQNSPEIKDKIKEFKKYEKILEKSRSLVTKETDNVSSE